MGCIGAAEGTEVLDVEDGWEPDPKPTIMSGYRFARESKYVPAVLMEVGLEVGSAGNKKPSRARNPPPFVISIVWEPPSSADGSDLRESNRSTEGSFVSTVVKFTNTSGLKSMAIVTEPVDTPGIRQPYTSMDVPMIRMYQLLFHR